MAQQQPPQQKPRQQPPTQPPPAAAAPVTGFGAAAGAASATVAAQTSLASSFYQAQALLAAITIRDVLVIWQGLNLASIRSSWPAIRTALAALIRDRFGTSAAQAQTYYQQARLTAGVTGAPPAIAVPEPPEPLIEATLDATGPYSLLGRIKQGQQVAQAAQTTGVVLSGAASRLVQNGGRQVILRSVKADEKAVAWMRVTGGNPCAFCAMLASRGAVYKSEASAGFSAHNHCECSAAPVFSHQDAAAMRDNDLSQQWKQATKGLSGGDAMKAWRQHWDAQQNRDGLRLLPGTAA